MSALTHWLEHYGYAVLFVALLLEMLALPLPGEFLMSYAGLLVYEGKLDWLLAVTAAAAGTSAGMTLSYWIGYRLGNPFFAKYGARFHLGPDKLDNVSNWFRKYGNKMLIVAYFIPGVRHLTGYFSGTTRLPYRKYAAYAYGGALFWVIVFVTLGKVLGPEWKHYHHAINRYMMIGGLAVAIGWGLVYAYRKNRVWLQERLTAVLERGIQRFHSMGKVKFVVLAAFVVLVSFLALLIGLIEDFLGEQLAQFDDAASYVVHQMFDSGWTDSMSRFAMLGSTYVFAPLIAITGIWIGLKGKDRMLEITFLAVVVAGGEALDEALRTLFHRTGPAAADLAFPYTFPSEQTLLTFTVCGFAAFLLVRHYGDAKLRIVATLLVIVLCLLVGVSRIFFEVEYPSDVVAGYAFGGVWLSMNVILLEIFRQLRREAAAA